MKKTVATLSVIFALTSWVGCTQKSTTSESPSEMTAPAEDTQAAAPEATPPAPEGQVPEGTAE